MFRSSLPKVKERPDQPLSIEQILNALTNEVVRSRVRNRALLRVLAKSEHLSMQEYVDAYRAEEEESFNVLVDMLTLAPEEFRDAHADWLDRDRATFGYRAESYPSVRVSPATEVLLDEPPTSALPAPSKGKGKKRTRKVSE